MHFKFGKLTNLHVGDHRNTVHGILEQSDANIAVSVRREMRGWTGYLVVIVGGYSSFSAEGAITHRNGISFHDWQASEEDRLAFDTLLERAFTEVHARRDMARERAVEIARKGLL